MRYLLLIYADEKGPALSPEEQPAYMDRWFKYSEELQQSGKMEGGNALQPTATATTVRLDRSNRLISDGPFAETKEQLGGYFLIDAKDLDEAIEWSSRMPHLPVGGSVEIRPIMEFDMPSRA